MKMIPVLSVNSSFKFVCNNKTEQKRAKRADIINQHDSYKLKTSNSVKTVKFQSVSKTVLSHQMEDWVSLVERGSIEYALQVFDEMTKRSSFVWNFVIRVLTNNGFFEDAIGLYCRMCVEGIRGDKFTFPFVIKACGGCLDLVEGGKVHSKLFKVGLDMDLHISNSLILMYAKHGCIEIAEKVFSEMRVRDLVSWNSMINGYILVNDVLSSLECVRKMQGERVQLDRFTIVSTLHASSRIGSLPYGKEIHTLVVKSDLDCNEMVQTSLIDMYGKSGGVCYAERLFNMISQRRVAVWNAMIRGYALNGQSFESFIDMNQANGHWGRFYTRSRKKGSKSVQKQRV